jgi:4-amino-4-deoxy-L-arabinose transferase-like glycosyltransferase
LLYRLAMPVMIFFLGLSEFAIRLPAVFFSVGTSLLIYHFASHLFDRRVGLLSALLFAILPWAIYWGNNAFYPSQLQFFTLLLTMLVHRFFFSEQTSRVLPYLICLSFLATFFSWEVAGIVLPVFLLIGLLMRPKRLSWHSSKHAWYAGCIIILAVVAQLTYRTILRNPYEKMGSSLSDMPLLQLAFTNTNFSPFFYVQAFVQSNAHLMISLFFVVGLFFLITNKSMRFLYILFVGSQLILTTVLGLYALRYGYFLLPYLLIIASAATVLFSDYLVGSLLPTSPVSVSVTVFRRTNIAVLFILQIAIALPWGLQGLNISSDKKKSPPAEFQYNHRGASFRTIAQALQEHYHPGDIVIVQAPSPLIVYTQLTGDYFLQSITSSAVFFDSTNSPYYMDKWVGNPVLRDRQDLQSVLYKNPRVWFLSVPHFRSMKRLEPDLQDLVSNEMTLVAESTNGRLYFWENKHLANQIGKGS